MSLLGERLKQLRNSSGLTQDQLGNKLESTRENISSYETGNSNPNIDMLLKMADFFKVTVDFLLCREYEIMPDEHWKMRAIKAEEGLQYAKSFMLLINREAKRFLQWEKEGVERK